MMKNQGKHNKKTTFTNKEVCVTRKQIFDIQLTEQIEIHSSIFFRNSLNSTFHLQLQITALKTF